MRIQLTSVILFFFTLLGAQPQEATLLGRWDREDLTGSSSYNNTYNEVWGMAINGREYAVIGSTAGTHFIDVTDPAQPAEVAFVAGAAQGGQVIHRDYHHYGCYLYAACDEGPSTLQIIDCSNLPASVEVVYDSDALFRRAHNIFIDADAAKLYAMGVGGGGLGYNPLRIYDLADPVDPQFVGVYNQFGGLFPSHVHDGFVRNNIAFLNLGFTGMAVVDFSDTANPQTLGTLTTYPFSGYNHSGWPTDDGQYYYLADENHGYRMKILDVSDYSDITYAGLFDAESESTQSIPHNQIVACDYLYVSYYYDGLQVYDISDPVDPQRVLYYPTSTRTNTGSYEGAWGVYPFLPSGLILVSDMQEGLFVLAGPGDACAARDESALSCGATATQEATALNQPAAGQLTVGISLAENQSNVKMTLLDLNGRLIRRSPVGDLGAGNHQLRLDTGNLTPGWYLLRLQADGWQHSERLIIGR